MRFISLHITCHLSYLYLKKLDRENNVYVFSVLRMTGKNKMHEIVSGIREEKKKETYVNIKLFS